MTNRPLAGKRVVITRPPHQAAPFAERLRALGAEPLIVPLVTIRPPTDPAPLEAALRDLERFDWVIFTSANAVEAVCEKLDELGLTLKWPPVAVIGPATGKALQGYGLSPALMPATHIAEALFEALRQHTTLAGARVFLPQADRARPVLADLLRSAGAEVCAVMAYCTVSSQDVTFSWPDDADAVTFTSASAVQSFAALFDNPAQTLGRAMVACIGPATAQAAHSLGLPVHAVAQSHTIDGLIAALAALFDREDA